MRARSASPFAGVGSIPPSAHVVVSRQSFRRDSPHRTEAQRAPVAPPAGPKRPRAASATKTECIRGGGVSTVRRSRHRPRLAARLGHGDAVSMDATELRELQSPLKRKSSTVTIPRPQRRRYARRVTIPTTASPTQCVVGPGAGRPASGDRRRRVGRLFRRHASPSGACVRRCDPAQRRDRARLKYAEPNWTQSRPSTRGAPSVSLARRPWASRGW